MEARGSGASMVMIDIRYMWSEMDSPDDMPKRRHPSRFVVFSCSRRWKKGIGDVGFAGFGNGSLDTSVFSLVLDCRRVSPRYSKIRTVRAEPNMKRSVYLHPRTMIPKLTGCSVN